MIRCTDENLIKSISEEEAILRRQPMEGFRGTKIGDIFEQLIGVRYYEDFVLCSAAYSLGKVHGIRQERAKRRR